MVHVQPCNAYSFVLKGKTRIDKSKLKKYKIKPGKYLQKLKQGKGISYKGKKYKAKDLTFKDQGKKVSFVLDTVMNNKIVGFVKNSDVLVCESTFMSELKNKAKEYKHLTSKQAGEIAKKSKSKELYLVHLSQRYSKDNKRVLSESRKIFKKTHIPKDLDVVLVG